jgi:putative proteasome-type protease
MDSTMKSNLSVGLPLDLVVYEANRLRDRQGRLPRHADNPYYRMLHTGWGQKLREVFDSLEDPVWDDAYTAHPLKMPATRHSALRKISTPEEKLI